MIEKLIKKLKGSCYCEEENKDKINEIIDYLNNKKNFHIFPDKDCEICWRENLKDKPSNFQFSLLKKELFNYYNHDRQEEKQLWQKKLKEAEAYYNKCDKINVEQCKRFGYIRANTEFDKLNDLYKQVIEELIKDNKKWEESANRYCKRSHVNYNKLVETQYQLEQLQQKQPDQECIEWGNNFLKRCKYGFQEGDKEMIIKLLKYFKEINDSN